MDGYEWVGIVGGYRWMVGGRVGGKGREDRSI